MGEVFAADGMDPNPAKVEAIKQLAPPKNVTEVRRFCGMINYLGRNTPNLSPNRLFMILWSLLSSSHERHNSRRPSSMWSNSSHLTRRQWLRTWRVSDAGARWTAPSSCFCITIVDTYREKVGAHRERMPGVGMGMWEVLTLACWHGIVPTHHRPQAVASAYQPEWKKWTRRQSESSDCSCGLWDIVLFQWLI